MTRRADQRVGALEQDDARKALDRSAQSLEPVGVDPHRVLADQPRELACVRGEHARPGPLGGFELEQRICIDDRGHVELREQTAHERALLVGAAESGPDGERRCTFGQLVDPFARRFYGLD